MGEILILIDRVELHRVLDGLFYAECSIEKVFSCQKREKLDFPVQLDIEPRRTDMLSNR